MAELNTDVVREELRVLSAASSDPVDPSNGSWVTPEFISMVSTVTVNLLTAATLVGWVDANSAQELTKAVTGIVTALGAVSINGMVVWKYLSARQNVQIAKLSAQYGYAAAVTTQRIVAETELTKEDMKTTGPRRVKK